MVRSVSKRQMIPHDSKRRVRLTLLLDSRDKAERELLKHLTRDSSSSRAARAISLMLLGKAALSQRHDPRKTTDDIGDDT